MMCTIGELKYIDMFQVVPIRLDALVVTSNNTCMKAQFPDYMEIICRKGLCLYEWVDDHSKSGMLGLHTNKYCFYA